MAEKSEALLLCEKMPEPIKTQFIRVPLEELRKLKVQPGGFVPGDIMARIFDECINATLTGETCWPTDAGVTFPVVDTAVSTRRNGSGVYIVRQEQIDTDAQHHDKEFRKMEDTEDGREIGSTASV